MHWLVDHGCDWDRRADWNEWGDRCMNKCIAAAMHGNLEALQWFRNNGCRWQGNELSASRLHDDEDSVCNVAARSDQLDVLQWCIDQQGLNGFWWNYDVLTTVAGPRVLAWLNSDVFSVFSVQS